MKKLFIFTILSLFILIFPKFANAEVINSFDVELEARKDGTMYITEKINYDFENADRHGIYRDIPLYSKVGELYRIIKINEINVSRDGNKEKFELTKSPKEISIKIGDPNKTITGLHEYNISYKVENGIGSNFPDFDEIYWNATGNNWQVPISNASFKVVTNFGINSNKIACFTRSGDYDAQFCKTDLQDFAKIITTNVLYPGDGLTAVYTFPKGTFAESILSKTPPQTIAQKIIDFIIKHIVLIYFILNIILPAILFFWYQKNKNKKRFGKPQVNFEIPLDDKGNRIIPAIAGIIDNAKLEKEDIAATIFDLAIRKYIKLEEIVIKKKLLPDVRDQRIRRLKYADENLNEFEKKLFQRLFISKDYVDTSELSLDFYKTFDKLEKEAFNYLITNKYYIKNPKFQKGFLFVLALLALFTMNIFLSSVLFFLSIKLNGRTKFGDEIDFKIDGLKLFLKSMNRNYKWQTEKFYTVEAMIPYAMSLGFIDQFMNELKILNPEYKPIWYSGYHGSFYLTYGSLFNNVNSNITTHAPSSSSGTSGGFSGGGGGGGGGGSW